GPPLSVLLEEQGKLPIDLSVELLIPLCLAMAYAHQNKVIHRDLKPSNIILAPDPKKPGGFNPKILDFGIAKTQFVDETNSVKLTKTGEVFGTPWYMSPEQCAGLMATERSDIYSMGCILFECLTGTPPFMGTGPLETLALHRNAKIPTLKEASLGIDFP